MRKGIEEFPCRPGVHCASKSLMDIAAYYGYNWSEPMVLGLGSGLGAYFYASSQWPSRAFIGRNFYLEPQFFETLGTNFTWRHGHRLPWNQIRSYLDQQMPVLAVADLKYLDYYDTVSLFGGHTLVLVGYDDAEERETVFVSDVNVPQIQETSLAGFKQALSSVSPIIAAPPNVWGPAQRIHPEPLPLLILRAIRKNAESMLSPSDSATGITALHRLAADLKHWPDLSNWRQCSLMFYEFCEKRGTGGAAFRQLYAQFLQEACEYVPDLSRIGAPAHMASVVNLWNQLTEIVFEAGRRGVVARFQEAAAVAHQIAEQEEALFTRLLTIC